MSKALKTPYDIQVLNGMSIALCIVFIFLMLFGLVSKFFVFDLIQIKVINIRGDALHHNATTLRENLTPKLKGNFFTIDLLSTKNAFESLPWVNKVSVQRVFPRQIDVLLEEHKAVAVWGSRDDAKMVNKSGTVFESELNDEVAESLPQFIGPEGQSALLLSMHGQLISIFDPLNFKLIKLELSERGSWHVTLEGGASIELGRGAIETVSDRAKRFMRTLELISSKFGKNSRALSYADLRHPDGYALRLNGVVTVGYPDIKSSMKK